MAQKVPGLKKYTFKQGSLPYQKEISVQGREKLLAGTVASNHGNLYNDLLYLLLGRYRVFHSKENGTE